MKMPELNLEFLRAIPTMQKVALLGLIIAGS